MSDVDLIRAELRALDDDALYARSVEAIRLGHSGRDHEGQLQPLDRLWRTECWMEWRRRSCEQRYREALVVVQAELAAARAANRPSVGG
jgi:hypothetical protein